jgi:hypothetical protein
MFMIDNKSRFLIDKFKISEELLCQILDISESIGTSKYNVWLSKESKKNPDILNLEKIRYVVDWAQIEKPDILSLDFESAFNKSEVWHKELKQNFKNISKQNFSESRIVYKCSDKEHFFIKLKPDELALEGELMGNCVGGFSYINRLKKREIIILSLRDKDNLPHVTIEICNKTGREIQTRGKCNEVPKKKYMNLIAEFALFAINPDPDQKIDEELLKLLQLKLN